MSFLLEKEQKILLYLNKGLNYKKIAALLNISKHSVKSYAKAVSVKTGRKFI